MRDDGYRLLALLIDLYGCLLQMLGIGFEAAPAVPKAQEAGRNFSNEEPRRDSKKQPNVHDTAPMRSSESHVLGPLQILC